MLRITLFCTFLCVFSFQSVASDSSTINKLVRQYEELKWFSGNVLVFKEGKRVFESSVGYSNIEEKLKNHSNTLFNIGSIQKNLTAVLVLQAVDEGLIKLDEPLIKYVSDLPNDISNKVKITHLLDHTSGLPDIFNSEYRSNFRKYDTIAKKITLLNDAKLLFEPGNERQYSNLGYILLGAILEKIYNRDYWELVKLKIMSKVPAKSPPNGLINAELYHYSYSGEKVLINDHEREHKSPDGGGYYSASVLISFYQQLFKEGELLSKSSLSFFKNLQKDNSQWVAFGGGKGVSAAVEINFQSGIWVCVLANTDGLVSEEISARIMKILHKDKVESVRIPPSIYAYKLYKEIGKKEFNEDFNRKYKEEGYSTFIGRVLTDLGRSLIGAGKSEESLFFFKYLVNSFPEIPEVYDGLAFGYFSSGYGKEALKAFQKGLAIKPNYQSLFHRNNYVANFE
jgi:CubicO group peptidase (beta-lactamase class C family)